MSVSAFTAPAALAVPRYSIDGLVLSGLGTVDDRGRYWELTGESGWTSGAPPRTSRTARASGHGSYRSPSWAEEISFSVRGTVHFDDPLLMEPTLLELRSLCRPSVELYPIRRTGGDVDQVRDAEIDAQREIEPVGRYDIDFQLTFASPDPRAHDATWQEAWALPPRGAANGLSFGTTGLNFSGAGLDFGTPGEPAIGRVANRGTADAHPVLIVTGPAPSPTIKARRAGWELTYRDYIEPGETVTINCDLFDARGFEARSVTSSRRGYARPLLSIGRDWPVVLAQDFEEFELQVAGSESASLTSCLRSAWW